jgi:uncharacterized protein with HEPN domain
LKATEPDVPWREIAGIGNVLRHDYGVVKPDILWGGRTYRLADSKAAVERIRGRLGGQQSLLPSLRLGLGATSAPGAP